MRRTRSIDSLLGILLLPVTLLALGACGAQPTSGPGEVVWDRDICERCQMLISDRRFAAQLRTSHDHRLHYFDDIGCAVMWIEEQGIETSQLEELWVASPQGEGWADGFSARYRGNLRTAMDYGFAAAETSEEETISFDEVRRRIVESEGERRSPDR
jgi:hypothetical protein